MKKNDFKRFIGLLVLAGTVFNAEQASSQAPSISYPSSSYTYNVGTAISPLVPTNTGGAVVSLVSTFAGNTTAGYTDANGLYAQFWHPMGIATDASGNVYVADRSNNRIRKIALNGDVTTLAGDGTSGYQDNTVGTSAKFNSPNSVAVDASGNVYVADESNQRIRKIDIYGAVTTYAGTGSQGYADNTNRLSASFNNPYGLCVDVSGDVYVADLGNGVVRKIATNGTVSTLASGFYTVLHVAADASGNVYAADAGNQAIYKITSGGTVTTYASGSFNHPAGVTVDPSGNIEVGDQVNDQVQKITPAQVVSTLAGDGSQGATNGAALSASFYYPIGVASDNVGNIYVGDYGNNLVRKITGQYTIDQALPAGLAFDSQTGIISGTPSAGSVATTYHITATNGSGSNTTSVTITVNPGSTINPSSNQNYIITYTPRTEISDITQFAGKSVGDVNQTIQYLDGLGRPMQTVEWQASPNHNDIVQPIAYDQYGRETLKYLPYANNPAIGSDGSYKTDAISFQQPAFYNAAWPTNAVTTSTPRAETQFEPSPLNRPVAQGAPGAAWQISNGHAIGITYGSNSGSEVVLWQVNSSYNGATGTSNYTAGTLSWTKTMDEDGHSNIEYKDMQGRVVCKKVPDPNNAGSYLSTSYIYDDYGNLAYVVPPTKDNTTYPTSFTEANTDPVFNSYIYAYHYDQRNRLIEKKIPGKYWEFMLYNTLDQVVASQDGNQRQNNQWTITKYDKSGRVVLTGLWSNSGGLTDRATLQGLVDGQTTPWQIKDFNAPGNVYGYYIVNNDPLVLDQVLTVNYYDDYSIPGIPYFAWDAVMTTPTGQLTASETVILKPDGTYGPMLWAVNFYDDKGRIEQTFKQHYLQNYMGTPLGYSTNNYDATQTRYNFDNSIKATYRYHFTSLNTTVAALRIDNAYYYDHVGRRYQNWEAITVNGGTTPPSTLLSQDEYNEIGQLKTKHLHNTGGSNFLQDVNYAYNERGWLTNSTAQLFAMQLNYNTSINTGPFNGNISSQYWGTPGNVTKSFNYTYDALNRLTSGISPTEQFAEQNIQYDNMGNITSLNRVNQLASLNAIYGYNYNGNQLQSVSGLTTGNYTYDNNGNMKIDARTGNYNSYNLLNLPRNINRSGLNIDYTYNANGQKLKKDNGSVVTDYIDGIQYDNGTITSIQTEEGRVLNLTGTYNFEYSLTDNLGNTRVTFDSNGGGSTAKQVDDYMPFGMEISRGTVPSLKNEYLYNKKELQEETGNYDYGARFYDPVIARWTSVDKLAEHPTQIDLSPYAYVGNNPILKNDPDGNCPLCFVAELIAEAYEAVTATQVVTATVGAAAATAVTMTAVNHFVISRPVMARDNIPNVSVPNRPAIIQSNSNQKDLGSIYRVPGTATKSGKPYIGRHNKPSPQKTRRSNDGRDRTQAEVVDTYDTNKPAEGREKEQKAIDDNGGVENLDNKRNEIKKDPPKTDPPNTNPPNNGN